MAPRHRRTRPGLWLLGGFTAGLGMLAGSSAAGGLPLDVTTTTIPVPAVEVPEVTVPATAPGVPAVPVVDSGVSDVTGIVGSTVDLPALSGGGGGSGSTSTAGGGSGSGSGGAGAGGPVTGELTARTASDDPAGSGGSDTGASVAEDGGDRARAPQAGGATAPPRDLRTLRRLAVQSAGDFSLPFLLGALALAYLFFQRRMSIDDPTLVAAAAEDDELLGFS